MKSHWLVVVFVWACSVGDWDGEPQDPSEHARRGSDRPAWVQTGFLHQMGFGNVVTSGDVNGDGFSDLVVNAEEYPNDDLSALVLFLGSSNGLSKQPDSVALHHALSLGAPVAFVGDVNADGFDDVLGGDTTEQAALLYLGTPGGLERRPTRIGDVGQFGFDLQVAPAGDVNGDGFADAIVGCPTCDPVDENEGSAFVYLGSVDGLDPLSETVLEGENRSDELGRDVAAAGDVNGDGFDDVLVGSGDRFDGFARVFHGSPTGIVDVPDWEVLGTRTNFGMVVSGAGDVNADGFDDVLVTDEERQVVYLGSALGLSLVPAWSETHFDEGQAVAAAGDLNADGFDDIVIGISLYESNTGRVAVFAGTPSGLTQSPVWDVVSPIEDASFGVSVAGAGDTDGDGRLEVAVGADFLDLVDDLGNVVVDRAGAVFVYEF